MKRILATALVACAMASAHSSVLLYSQNFETPTGFVNDGGDINIFRSVNRLYGNQPPGFAFAQNFTVETLRIGSNQAFGTGYQDPQGVGGQFALGMLSGLFGTQDDLLGLSFNVGPFKFLNFSIDISSIDLDRFGCPCVPPGGAVPSFRLSLFDNPSGATGLGTGALLSSADISGISSPNKAIFDWTNHIVALDATGNTNGNVTVRIDLLTSGYASMDNFFIAASDTPGDVTVPEPASAALVVLGLGALVCGRRWARAGQSMSPVASLALLRLLQSPLR